jgi:hypothetical protein
LQTGVRKIGPGPTVAEIQGVTLRALLRIDVYDNSLAALKTCLRAITSRHATTGSGTRLDWRRGLDARPLLQAGCQIRIPRKAR